MSSWRQLDFIRSAIYRRYRNFFFRFSSEMGQRRLTVLRYQITLMCSLSRTFQHVKELYSYLTLNNTINFVDFETNLNHIPSSSCVELFCFGKHHLYEEINTFEFSTGKTCTILNRNSVTEHWYIVCFQWRLGTLSRFLDAIKVFGTKYQSYQNFMWKDGKHRLKTW